MLYDFDDGAQIGADKIKIYCGQADSKHNNHMINSATGYSISEYDSLLVSGVNYQLPA